MTQQIAKLTDEVGPAVLIDRDVVNVTQSNSRLTQTILNRLNREPGPVLHPAKALLLSGGDQLAVPHERCCGIRVEGVESENDQVGPFFSAQNIIGGKRYDAYSDKASKYRKTRQSAMTGASDNRQIV